MKPWHERDEFWETLAPVLFGAERFEAAPEQVDQVIELSGGEPGARVLDLACGPGRHAIEFARRGCGCENVKVYGGLDGRPYDHEARRLTLVGRVE